MTDTERGRERGLIGAEETLPFPGLTWAVFNNHVNDADARAIAICRLAFDADDAEMMALEASRDTGIMRIFQHQPTSVTSAYAALCFAFANGLDKAEGRR